MDLVSYAVELVSRAGPGYESINIDSSTWRVRTLELREALDEPFVLELEMICDDIGLDPDALVGGSLQLFMQGPELERAVRGIVTAAHYIGTFDDTVHIQLFVGPSLALAGLYERSRIFQALAVPDIVAAVLGEHLGPQGTVDTTRLADTYPPRDYCVQFRETDLAFARRILAEAGIHFILEQDLDSDAQTLALVDRPSGFRPAVTSADDPEPREPPLLPIATGATDPGELACITTFEWRRRAATANHQVRHFDWLASSPAPVEATAAPDGPAPWEFGERYRHGTERALEDGGAHPDETTRLAAILRERAQTGSSRAYGRSNELGLSPGTTMAIDGHPHAPLDRTYLLTQVTHTADCPEADLRAGSGLAGQTYGNRFQCVPADTPTRPAPQPRPRVGGQQTATVVGPSGEEIHTDEHGRIRVWMHWERDSPDDAVDHSCWLRVAQPLAGSGFGTMFLPRVGMDVLVSFVDADPDRPVCVGCLYDGGHATPYPLPDERTKTTIKTQTSPGGGGFNELSFEDAKGSEQVYLHAQRNLDEQVLAAHTMNVGSIQQISVGADQSLKVGGSQELKIQGNRTITVTGTPKQGVPEGLTTHVVGDIKTDASKTYELVAPQGVTIVCGGSIITMTPQSISFVAGDGAVFKLDSGMMAAAAGAKTSMSLGGDGVAALTSMSGGGLKISSTIDASSGAGSSLTIDDKIGARSSGAAALELSSDAKMKGNVAQLDGLMGSLKLDTNALMSGTSATVQAGAASLKAAAGGVSVAGATVDVVGSGLATLLAPLVKIN